MTQLEHQVRKAQRRLWYIRWLDQLVTCAAIGGGLLAITVLIRRSFDLALPLGWSALGFGCLTVAASIIWTLTTREGREEAAARLDEAAGLRERISSGCYCVNQEDPFAKAVVADAEQISKQITVRQHLRLTVPRHLGLLGSAAVLSLLMFLIPVGLLKKSEADVVNEAEDFTRTSLAVERQMDRVRKLIEDRPALEDLRGKLPDMDKGTAPKLHRASDVRHEAVKRIDQLADMVQQKKEQEKFRTVSAMRKLMRGLDHRNSENSMTQKLTRSLRSGDFKTAKEEIAKLKEQLATLKADQDKEMVKQLGEQLQALSKQLEKLASSEDLQKELEKTGIKKEDAKRLLERLSKKDIEQLEKELAQQGMNQQQIQDMMKKMAQQQQAKSMAQKMAQSMQQAANKAAAGDAQDAAAGLQGTEAQLSELEQLEQEMSQLEATMADLQNTKDNLDKPCSQCQGTGKQGNKPCPSCQGTGQSGGQGQGGSQGNRPGQGGMGPKIGQGRGGLAPEEESTTGFKVERGKVPVGKGAIIGQFFVEGEQVKGEIDEHIVELLTPAEREASDRIQRDRIPRQYQSAVKKYFSNVKRMYGVKGEEKKDASSDGDNHKEHDHNEEATPNDSDG